MFEPAFWNWLILAGIFLLLEACTVSFFFLLWGVAALGMVGVTAFAPAMGWQWQGIAFTGLSVIALVFWYAIARHWRQNRPQDEAARLNNRGFALIGRQFVLDSPICEQYGRLHIDDSLWTLYSPVDLPAGTRIRVVRIDSTTLHVEALNE